VDTIAIKGLTTLSVVTRNNSLESLDPATYVYLFSDAQSVFVVYAPYRPGGGLREVEPLRAHSSDAPDGLLHQYRLPTVIPLLPPGASEKFYFAVAVSTGTLERQVEETLRLRIHTADMVWDYRFKLAVQESGHDEPTPK